MKILILGGDGYLGWPTSMYLAKQGHDVTSIDNLSKREWEKEIGVTSLFHNIPFEDRVDLWNKNENTHIDSEIMDITDTISLYSLLRRIQPDAIVHYAEQPSAPFSMAYVHGAVTTQTNNVIGTLNLTWAVKDCCPDAHIVKLGTMGEYGTPNIDIEEGYLTVTHNEREHTFLYPKTAGSFYHLSKVHDSNNLDFACRMWDLKITDLNQGVVYGTETRETKLHKDYATNFHYDSVFGTALNRFCVQAIAGKPITPYGKGTQKRAFLNIQDTLACVELAILNPPTEKNKLRVFNQFTETFTVNELASLVKNAAKETGINATIDNIENPRKELEEHYFNPKNSGLINLGLAPRLLSETLVEDMLVGINNHKARIDNDMLSPKVKW